MNKKLTRQEAEYLLLHRQGKRYQKSGNIKDLRVNSDDIHDLLPLLGDDCFPKQTQPSFKELFQIGEKQVDDNS